MNNHRKQILMLVHVYLQGRFSVKIRIRWTFRNHIKVIVNRVACNMYFVNCKGKSTFTSIKFIYGDCGITGTDRFCYYDSYATLVHTKLFGICSSSVLMDFYTFSFLSLSKTLQELWVLFHFKFGTSVLYGIIEQKSTNTRLVVSVWI